MKFLLLMLMALSAVAADSVIPSDRRADWQTYAGMGTPPWRETIYTNLTSLDGTGTTNMRTIIQAALTACPYGQVVKLPAGEFLCTAGLTITGGKTLRGEGTNTILKFALGGYADALITMGTSAGGDDVYGIASDMDIGTTNLSLRSATYLVNGGICAIEQTNVSGLVENWSDEPTGTAAQDLWYSTNCMIVQLVRITSISGTNITIWPPLIWDFTNTISSVHQINNGGTSSSNSLENLRINQTTSNGEKNIAMYQCRYSWIRGVESYNCSKYHLQLNLSFGCNVSSNYFHGSQGDGSGGNYGISLAFASGFNVIEDNIVEDCTAGLLLTEMVSGNVFGYNYVPRSKYSPTNWLQANISMHDAHPVMNLIEGNVANMVIADHVHGSSSHNTVFRNRLNGWQYGTTTQNRAVAIDNYNTYWNIVGNVLGTTSTWFQYITNGPNAAPTTTNYIYQLGCSGVVSGGAFPFVDANVAATTIRRANYSYSASGYGVAAEESVGATNLVDSYYLSSKPAWFGVLDWPPVNPVQGTNGLIPAQARYLGIDYGGSTPEPPAASPSRRVWTMRVKTLRSR